MHIKTMVKVELLYKGATAWKWLIFPLTLADWMDQSHINKNIEPNKSRQKFHHSVKEDHKISNIPKFRGEKL